MKLKNSKGFTLIELLIVVAIIAILAAIAIPQFAQYRTRGIRASMIADGRNTATQMEAMFTDQNSYGPALAAVGTGPTTIDLCVGVCGVPAGSVTYNVNLSKGNALAFTVANATVWTLTVTNGAGDGGGYLGPVTMTSAGACSWASGGNC